MSATIQAIPQPQQERCQVSAHTPGPWEAKYEGDSRAIVTAARNSLNPRKAVYDYVLAKVEDFSPEATQANARLIAAAPEMLEALRTALEQENWAVIGSGSVMVERQVRAAFDRARAAIAKAEGEPVTR